MTPTSSQVRACSLRPAGACRRNEPAAGGSVFRPCGVIDPVLGLLVGPARNGIILPAEWTVRIAVVRMQMDRATGTAMVSGDRPIMIRVCGRKSTEEREPGRQCYCRKFHDHVVRVVCTNDKWAVCLIVPLKFSLSAAEAPRQAFLRHERCPRVPELTRSADIKLNPRVSLRGGPSRR
jgi:hypothetical protein